MQQELILQCHSRKVGKNPDKFCQKGLTLVQPVLDFKCSYYGHFDDYADRNI